MAAGRAIVQGMDFVKDQLKGFLPKETTAVMRRTTTRIAANIRKDMRSRAPRKTGTLRRAIISKRQRGTKDSIEAAVFVTRGSAAKHDAYYWHFVEYGTVKAPARPFLGPAIENARRTYKQDLANEVRRQVIKQLEKRAKLQRVGKR